MNKSELIEQIAESADVSKAVAGRTLNATLDAITAALEKSDTVTLVGFGTFYVGERKARPGRNPKTGEVIQIPASSSPKFRPGKALKDAVSK